MALVPYEADVAMSRWPIANFVLIGVITLSSLAAFLHPVEAWAVLILHDWSVSGLVGHVLLHGGYIHLFGNMMFLWVFGNAVCAKVGNGVYVPLFFGFGLVAGVVHTLLDGAPALGASGAINGVVGAFLIFYPLNEISCFWTVFIRAGTFAVSSIWLILLWLAFDVWGLASGEGSTAYWAHLGGFAAGAGFAAGSLYLNWIEMTDTEVSLLDLLSGNR